MIYRTQLKYESCACCSRPIRTGHPFIICAKCDSCIHKKCSNRDNIIHIRGQNFCSNCVEIHDIHRYNPFFQTTQSDDQDHHYDTEPADYIESINSISNTLENCQRYSISDINSKIMALPANENFFSTYFLNIDGNLTNFDNFTLDILVGWEESETPRLGCILQM